LNTNPEHLRPLERRVLSMRRTGMSIDDIARRFRSSPDHMRRVLQWSTIPRNGPPKRQTPPAIERRIVAMRVGGMPYEQIAARLRRSQRSIRQIEGLTYFLRGSTQIVFDRGRDLLRENAEQARRDCGTGNSDHIREEATPWLKQHN